MSICSITGCGGISKSRGLCEKHYARFRRWGDPSVVKSNATHGFARTTEYRSWVAMKSRCLNKKRENYKYYGGRGIKICDRWMDRKNGFVNFLADMGKKPGLRFSLDRIDNNGHYAPNNCRWATPKQQRINTRSFISNPELVEKAVDMMLAGERNYAISDKLGISKRTVESIRSNHNKILYKKLMVKIFGRKSFEKLEIRAALSLKSLGISKRELINDVIKRYRK